MPDSNSSNDLQRALQQIAMDLGDLRSAIQASEQRTQEFVRDTVQNSELQLTKLVRDTETNLLNAFFLFQEHEKIQFQRLKVDSGNASRAGELRIDNLEQRILELERRVLRRRDDDSAPRPS